MASENKELTIQLILRNDIEDNWQAFNPCLNAGEIGVSFDDLQNPTWRKFKIGDGIHSWNELEFTCDLDSVYSKLYGDIAEDRSKSIRDIASEEAHKIIMDYATIAALPKIGSENILYVVLSEKASYIWSNGNYVCIGNMTEAPNIADELATAILNGGVSYHKDSQDIM